MTDLGELGLSSYEQTAYRTLLVTGAASAADLSDASGVPKGRIYDVLNGLVARGIVRTRSGDPKRYAPVDPEAVVDRLLAEREAELERERDRYRAVAESVRSELSPAPPTDSSFWLGSLGSDEMSTALVRHLRAAEDRVRAAVGVPYENASWEALRSEYEAFFDGASADVDVELICSEAVLAGLPDRVRDSIADRSADVAVRIAPEVPVSFDLVDRAAAAIDVPHPAAPGDRLGVVGVRDPEVVVAFDRQFEQLWSDATAVLE